MKPTLPIAVLFLSAASFGCIPASSTGDKSASTTSGVTAEEATPRKTIGKTTQKVLDLKKALANGAVLASTSVEANNPLMASADAYRTTVGKLGGFDVTKKIQLRNASSIKRPQPLTYDVFMAEIIEPGGMNGIRLPMLPYYQEYAWDEANQDLVVVDFPARKEERAKQR
ncbi:hypothetical protein LF1_46900 [Rubripirellula obstinata]|uniref:Uncharacterized protein n=1 Tax=Rubripirellula obstinata TaxID=406547 RepID=A0A5B1CQK0_9BACT|nr:hypothetical protein [Rubripirellula obstinata]KAA1262129.1 hypothetical protein LF1_46900 [Rubripirellula obstinata]